jgi:hypothetical protein
MDQTSGQLSLWLVFIPSLLADFSLSGVSFPASQDHSTVVYHLSSSFCLISEPILPFSAFSPFPFSFLSFFLISGGKGACLCINLELADSLKPFL